MNDDVPSERLAALRLEHRALDERIAEMRRIEDADQLEIARMKKRKLRVKDEISLIEDRAIPDIIA